MTNDEFISRSQAEELLAAERAETMRQVKHWSELYKQQHYRAEKAEADNAALTARVKELDHENNSWMKSAIKQQERAKALETQLTALTNEIKRLKDALGKIYRQPSNRAHFIAVQALNNK